MERRQQNQRLSALQNYTDRTLGDQGDNLAVHFSDNEHEAEIPVLRTERAEVPEVPFEIGERTTDEYKIVTGAVRSPSWRQNIPQITFAGEGDAEEAPSSSPQPITQPAHVSFVDSGLPPADPAGIEDPDAEPFADWQTSETWF